MNVSSVKNLNGEVFSAVQDASLTNVVQTNSAQWGQGGGGSVSSKYGTISVDSSNIEATNKAIEFNSNGFTSSFDNQYVSNGSPLVLTWDNYSQETSISVEALNNSPEDATLTYSSNTNVTGEVTAASYTLFNFDVNIPNATAIQFSTDKSLSLQRTRVTAPTSLKISELAWKSDLPTYEYNSNHKVSSINGSALVGNEDYLVEQGFVQNLTSPKGTVSVLNNNKIEGTNSAIASDVIEGFVSAYNGVSVYPEHSATLTWERYVPNTMLFVSGAEYHEHTLTYSANTNVTGVITTPIAGQVSFELPTNSTSIVIGNENWSNITFNFTVSADNYYEIGELAWASAIPTYEYDSTNKISAINGSAIAGGSDLPVSADEAIQYVQTNSAVINDTITNVTANSGAWGGSALPISAGPGIKFEMVDNTLVASTDETVLWSGEGATACTLSETPSAFDRIRLYGYRDEGQIANSRGCWEFPTTDMTGFDISQYLYNDDNTFRALYLTRYALNGLNFSAQKAIHFYATTADTSWSGPGSCAIKIDKVVGINRVSGVN